MPDAPASDRAARAPWILAGVFGVVVVVLLVVFFVPLKHARDSAVPGKLTGTEQRAVNAASTEVANVLTTRRAHFDADYGQAVAGATGSFKQDLVSRKTKYRQALTAGKFDTSAQIVNQALVGATAKGGGFVVLVTVNGYQSTAPNSPVPSHLEITMQRVKGKFLASNFKSIEIS